MLGSEDTPGNNEITWCWDKYGVNPSDHDTVLAQYNWWSECFDCSDPEDIEACFSGPFLLEPCLSQPVCAGVPRDADDSEGVTRLFQNAPNPVRGGTKVRFSLARASRVRIAIYDVRGRLVVVLSDCHLEAGLHTLKWEGNDSRGSPASSGIYFCKMVAESFTSSNKIVLLR
jgi:hypothetical protein